MEYEPEFGENIEDNLTSETDTAEASEDEEPEALLLVVNDDKEKGMVATEEHELVDHKLCLLEDENKEKLRDLFAEYGHVIESSFDHIRLSKVETKLKFELLTDELFYRNIEKHLQRTI